MQAAASVGTATYRVIKINNATATLETMTIRYGVEVSGGGINNTGGTLYITAERVTLALTKVAKKKKLVLLDRIRFEPYHEGLSAQVMHLGPYAAEAPTIARLHYLLINLM